MVPPLQAQEELAQLQFAVQESLPRERESKQKRLRAAQEVLDSNVNSEVRGPTTCLSVHVQIAVNLSARDRQHRGQQAVHVADAGFSCKLQDVQASLSLCLSSVTRCAEQRRRSVGSLFCAAMWLSQA